MTTTSPLVQRAIIAATTEMDSDVELFGVPVDLPGRAVVFVTAPVRLVVKVDQDPTRLLREKMALERLADTVQIPQLWFATAPTTEAEPGTPTEPWILGASYVDGERLSHTATDEAWVDLGRQVAAIHRAPTDGWSEHPSERTAANKWATLLATQARDAGIVDETIAQTFLSQAISESRTDRQPCLIHGDLTADNVFSEGDQVSGLIDLGDCGIGDPAYDLATATLWNQDRLDLVLAGYCESGGMLSANTDLKADVNRFQLMRLLAGALWLKKYEFATTPYVGELYERLLVGLPDS